MKRTVSVASLGRKGLHEPTHSIASSNTISINNGGSQLVHVNAQAAKQAERIPGLGIAAVLHTQESFPGCVTRSYIATRTALKAEVLSNPNSSPSSGMMPSFLRSCSLCNKDIASSGRDIYMYRGIQAFCSAECRHQQIYLDERLEKRNKCASLQKVRQATKQRSKFRAAAA